jgi:Mitochondrial biogenesis AIM24
VLLAPGVPGEIILLHLSGKEMWAIQKGAFLAADPGVDIGMLVQSFSQASWTDRPIGTLVQSSLHASQTDRQTSIAAAGTVAALPSAVLAAEPFEPDRQTRPGRTVRSSHSCLSIWQFDNALVRSLGPEGHLSSGGGGGVAPLGHVFACSCVHVAGGHHRKPIGYTWSYLACRTGNTVPIWQPFLGSSFQS